MPPFSACIQTSAPVSLVCSNILRMAVSSSMKVPGYAINSLKLVTPSLDTNPFTSPSWFCESSLTIRWNA